VEAEMISELSKTAIWANSHPNQIDSKQIERQYLHSFRCLCSDFPNGNIQDNETPDFLIVTEAQQKIGIELTEMFKVDGETKLVQQSIEATKERITVAAKKIYSECLNSPPAHVALFFCLQVPLKAKRCWEIARCVAQFVHDKMPPEGESVQLKCSIGGPGGKPIAVDLISINRVHPVNHNKWSWPEAGAVETNAVPLFEKAIRKKATKLDECLQKCDECWLLIVAPSFKSSGMIHPDGDSLSHTYASPFSRTYFLDFGRGRVVRLQDHGPLTQLTQND
jgi:hypothetical protein